MALPEPIPVIDNKAYNKNTSEYVSYASRSDAMLASLQTFHEVPYEILDLVMTMINHQDFDSKQVTLKNSAGVIQHIEDARLEERMAMVQRRSTVEASSGDVITEQLSSSYSKFWISSTLSVRPRSKSFLHWTGGSPHTLLKIWTSRRVQSDSLRL